MTWIPQTNARLLSVHRSSGPGGSSEDYDHAAESGSSVWQGSFDSYVQRKIATSFNDNGELRRALQVTFYISADLPVTLEAGDTLTYEAGNPINAQTFAGRIQNVVNPAYLPQMPDYYKCALEEITVPSGT